MSDGCNETKTGTIPSKPECAHFMGRIASEMTTVRETLTRIEETHNSQASRLRDNDKELFTRMNGVENRVTAIESDTDRTGTQGIHWRKTLAVGGGSGLGIVGVVEVVLYMMKHMQ